MQRSTPAARCDALLRLVITEAAVRHYQGIHGSPPESLQVLVPDELSAVPADPFGTGPLKYRVADDSYQLYSVGGNGTDDGGRRETLFDAVHAGKGDLFYDPDTNGP